MNEFSESSCVEEEDVQLDTGRSWIFVTSHDIETNNEINKESVDDDAKIDKDDQDSDGDSISIISRISWSSEDDAPITQTTNIETTETENTTEPDTIQQHLDEDNADHNVVEETYLDSFSVVQHENQLECFQGNNPRGVQNWMFFGSAICAVLILGLSVVAQQYFEEKIDADSFVPQASEDISLDPYCTGDKCDNLVNNYKDTSKYYSVHSSEHENFNQQSSFKNSKNMDKYQSKSRTYHKSKDQKYQKRQPIEYVEIESDIYNEKNIEEKLIALELKEKYLLNKEKVLKNMEEELEKRMHSEQNNHILEKGKRKGGAKTSKDKHYSKKGTRKNKISKQNGNSKQKISDNLKQDKDYVKYKNYSKQESIKIKHHNKNFKKRNITGQWYINLHKARNEIRQQERSGDWFFDRSYVRSLRRNKAHWYFDWMVDRERLRTQ